MNTTQHPLVTHYLDDLGRMLDHLLPADRAEVLAGVREHIEAGLAERRGATDADVSAVLGELGPPEAVAREAYESGLGPGPQATPYAAPSPLPAPPVRSPISDRPWVPVAVAVLQVLGLLMMVVIATTGAVYSSFESSDGVTTVNYSVGSSLVMFVAGGVMVLPLWIPVVLLAGNSSRWTARQKVIHALLLPVSALLLGASADLGWVLAGERGLNVASVASLVLVVAFGAWLVARLTRGGRAAAAR